jgi:hypothetical protein
METLAEFPKISRSQYFLGSNDWHCPNLSLGDLLKTGHL